MSELTPVYRIEHFLYAIINGTVPPAPVFREEFYLAKIAGADVETPKPICRLDFYLARIAGDNVEIPIPIQRNEYFLAFLCGMSVDLPEPIFRMDYWLSVWVDTYNEKRGTNGKS